MIEVKGHPFKEEVFRNAFSDLFSSEVAYGGNGIQNQKKNGGPMYYILRDHMLDIAKGGRDEKFNPGNKYRDTSYFNHVLNFLLISGKALENDLSGVSFDFKGNEPAIRAFFAAIVLHDFNKLHFDGEAITDIRTALNTYKIELERMVQDYVPDYPSKLSDIRNLILSTEQGYMGYTDFTGSSYVNLMYNFIPYMRLGDEVSSILSENIQPYKAYDKISNLIKNKFSGIVGGEVKMISLGDRPQTVLRNAVCFSLAKAIEEKATLIGVSPMSIIYVNPPSLSMDEIRQTASKYLSDFIKSMDLYRIYKPSGNKFDPSFLSWVDENQLDDYLKKYAHEFFFLENVDSLREAGLKQKLINMNYKFENRKDDKLVLKPIDEKPEGEEDLKYSELLRLFAARRISWTNDFDKQKWRGSAKNIEKLKDIYDRVKPNSVSGKTIESLEYAYSHLADFNTIYHELLRNMMTSGKSVWPLHPQYDSTAIINTFLDPPLDFELEAPSKIDACIFCGRKGEIPFRETHAFGYSATSGTGRKVSELNYVKDYKVCSLCATEAEMRIKVFRDYSLKGNEDNVLSLHVSMGDYVHPFDVSSFVEEINYKLKNEHTGLAGKDDNDVFVMRLSKIRVDTSKYFFDYHYLSFTPIRSEKEKYDQFLLLLNVLHDVRASGFKVRISALVSGSRLFKEMFVWENAPPWVVSLGFDEIRIDEIDVKIRKADIIWKLKGSVRTEKEMVSAIARIISTLARDEFSIYSIVMGLAAEMESVRRGFFIKNMYPDVNYYAQKYARNEYMEMEKLVEPALGIVRGKNSNPESGNDDTWIIRTAFETIERERRESEKDIVSMIAGNIRDKVMRDSDSLYNQDVENSIRQFSENFIEYYREHNGRLNSMSKRDIINAFGFEYHARKWAMKPQSGSENIMKTNYGGDTGDQ